MRHRICFLILLIASALSGVVAGACLAQSPTGAEWKTAARWRRSLKKAVPGTLIINTESVEFRSAKFSERWPNVEIQTFDLSSRELALTSYQNRRWNEPGVQRFRFTLDDDIPPDVASALTARVGKPSHNGVAQPGGVAIAEIPAHRRTWRGGSNGTLRLKEDGIDYVAGDGPDTRSWRWADIQTIANPNPYELRVTGYREIVEFDLKKPMSREVFERVWERLYADGLNVATGAGGELR
jgi:hypothetical protein